MLFKTYLGQSKTLFGCQVVQKPTEVIEIFLTALRLVSICSSLDRCRRHLVSLSEELFGSWLLILSICICQLSQHIFKYWEGNVVSIGEEVVPPQHRRQGGLGRSGWGRWERNSCLRLPFPLHAPSHRSYLKRGILNHISLCSRNVIHWSVKKTGFLVSSVHLLGGIGGRAPVHSAMLRIVLDNKLINAMQSKGFKRRFTIGLGCLTFI